MKKALGFLIAGIILATGFTVKADDATQSVLNAWKVVSGYITPRTVGNGLKVPALSSGGNCVVTDASGVFSTASCGTGGGGASTTIAGLKPSDGVFVIATSSSGTNFTFSTSSPRTLTFTFPASPTFTNLTYTGQGTFGLASGTSATLSGNLWVSGQTALGNASSSALTVSGVTTLATTTITRLTVSGVTTLNGVNLTWPASNSTGNQLLQNDGAGNLSWVTDQTGGGGSLSGGTRGYVMTWASSTGATFGTLIDNGTVAGQNATSSTVSFNIQGTAGKTPFVVASSSGTALLTVGQNGSTTLASLGTGIARSSSGALYNGIVGLTSDVAGILPLANGGIATTTLGNLTVGSNLSITGGQQVLIGTSTSISLGTNVVTGVSNDTNIQGSVSGNTLTFAWSGVLSVARGGTGTSTAPTTQGQLLMADNTGLKYMPGNLVAGTNVTITTTTPGQITIAASGGSGSPGGTGGQAQYNNGGAFAGSAALLTNGTVSGVNATSSATSFTVKGTGALNPFNVTSSTNTSLLSVDVDGNLFSYRANSSYAQQQFALSSALNGGVMFYVDSYGALSGSAGAYTLNGSNLKLNNNGGTSSLTNYNNSNNSNLQIFTGYGFAGLNANQYLQLAYSGSGSVINSFILNGIGKITLGTNAPTPGTSTSTTPMLLVQDTSFSTAPLLAVASSSNAVLFQINANGRIGIGTTTPTESLTIQATTTQTFGLFNVASSSGASYFKITANGLMSVYGSLPTVSSCGTSPSVLANSSNHAGFVKAGSAGPTSCTITFVPPFTNTPACTASSQSNSSQAIITSSTPTTLKITATGAFTSETISWICMGLNEPN